MFRSALSAAEAARAAMRKTAIERRRWGFVILARSRRARVAGFHYDRSRDLMFPIVDGESRIPKVARHKTVDAK